MGQVAESMKNFVRKERRIWDRGTTVQVLQKDKKHQIYALAVPSEFTREKKTYQGTMN